ncbi:MAG: DNA mismatch repair protein MutS [Bacteroidota bacterium]|nr:DNA mismatch repair protein MutS [Bacteroidota bacterium]
MEPDIIDNYKQRVVFAQQEANKYKQLANTYSLLRLGIFGLMVLAVYFSIVLDDFTILAVAWVLLIFGFMWLVSRQGEFDRQKEYFLNLVSVNQNETESILTRGNIYNNGSRYADERHYYSDDLDIFGSASLFKLVNRAATSAGNDKLSAWLSAPAAKDVIESRQLAVKELSLKTDWRMAFQARLIFANTDDINQLQRLFKYLYIPLDLPGEKWLAKYCKIAPYMLLAAMLSAYFYPVIKVIPILIGLINLGIVFSKAAFIKKADLIAGKIGGTLGNYATVFEKIEQEPWQSSYCSNLNETLKNGHTSEKIKELSDLINKLNYHLNMIVGFLLNLFFLWDIRQIMAIEHWKRDNQHNFEEAFDVIGEYEALVSLSSLAANYPKWCFPIIADETGYTLNAKGLAHPLIDHTRRIENDYELNDAFHIDIITGSNMAGKSTFLRTAGINTVLALCGAPVCATSMQVSVMQVLSYMRIKDSLNESTSTFKAELDRLKMLLAAVDSDKKVFFLIDEMLRGTNSVDKYLGSKAIIEKLIRKKAVGMVATHDLQIAELEKTYPDYIRNYYFDIQVKNGEMLFDYKIKHGECKTFNASLLLKQIGIDVGSGD